VAAHSRAGCRGTRAGEDERERERSRRGRVGRRSADWRRGEERRGEERRGEERREAREGGRRSYESGAAVFVSPSHGHHVPRD